MEVASKAGCKYSQLVQRAKDIDWRALKSVKSIGVTAGASAPDILIQEVVEAFSNHYNVKVEYVETAQENVNFKVPRILRELDK